jgi:hypothetical protein
MFQRFRLSLYNKIESNPKFIVRYLEKRTKLILTDEYLKISTCKYHYESIVRFGFEKKIFFFIIQEDGKQLEIRVISKTPKKIHNQLYQKCLELLEAQEPIIDIHSLPEPPKYLP